MKKVLIGMIILTIFFTFSFISKKNKCLNSLNYNINKYVNNKKIDLILAENTLKKCLQNKELKNKEINYLVNNLYYDKISGQFDFKN